VVDDRGQQVTSGSYTVSVGLAPGSNAGVLTGQTTVTTANGVAVFANLRINRAGTGYRLQATAAATATAGQSTALDIAVVPTIVDSTRLRLTSTVAQQANGTYVFQASAGAPTVQPGTVLVGAQGGGYLRRVTSVSQSGATVIAQTEAAALDDVIREGSVRTTTRLDITDRSSSLTTSGSSVVQWGAASVTTSAPGITISNGRFNFSNVVLWDGGADRLVLESGFLQFTPDVTLEFDFAAWKVRRVSAQASGNLTLGLGVSYEVGGSRTISVPSLTVAKVSKSFRAIVNGLPVYGRVETNFLLVPQLSAQARAKISTNASATVGVTVGATYNGSTWAFNAGPSAQTDFQFPGFTVEAGGAASARVGARVETRVFVYGIVQPYLWAEPYVQAGLTADLIRNIASSSCRSAIELGVGISAKIFSATLVDFNKSDDFVVTPNWPICQREIPVFLISSITATQGSAQSAAPGTTLPTALGVRVLGSNGSLSVGVPVQWVVTGGGGAVSSVTTPTNANGIAQTSWTLGSTIGEQRVEARLAGATGSPVIFTATARNVGTVSTVGGVILDEATNVPLGNVSVDFVCGGVAQSSVRSAADGRFTSPSLPAGSCQLTATLAGYDPLIIASVPVQAGLNNNLGILRMKRPQVGDLGGVVRDVTTNVVIGGANVEIRPGTNTTGTAVATTVTAANGAFQFRLLPAGSYTISLSAQGFVSASFGAVVVIAGTSRTQDFTLNPSTGVPASPTELVATSTPTLVSLAWRDNSLNETGFSIERRVTGQQFGIIGQTPANVGTFINASVTAGASYEFRVRSLGSAGNSGYSNVVSVTIPLGTACGVPLVVSNSINTPTVWSAGSAGCVHIKVSGTVEVSSDLTIQPGTNVSFGSGARLRVFGSMAAVGTPSARIRMTGEQPVRGHWDGIEINSSNTRNELAYVDLAYGGGAA